MLLYTARPVSQFLQWPLGFVLLQLCKLLFWSLFGSQTKTRGANVLFYFSIPTFCNTTILSLSSTFPLLHAAGWWRDQGEQVLREGSGGDAGFHADHHVLDVLIHALPPPFCEHAASWSKHGSLNSQASLVLKLFQLLNCPRHLFP